MKHLNKHLRRVLALVIVAAALVGVAAGASTATKKMIEANYRNIKLVVNGVEVTPKDADGKVVEPFISEGTTYLPLRALCNAMGYSNDQIKWDGETNTIYVGKVPGVEENWMTKLPPYQYGIVGNSGNKAELYDGSNPKKYFTVSGVNHLAGMTFSNSQKLASFNTYAIWNTNAQYKTMTFTAGNLDGWQGNATMEVYLDGEYSETYELKWDAPPKTYDITLNHAANVKLVFNTSKASTAGYGMYDISFSE